MRVVVLATGVRTGDCQHGEFGVEPPDEDLIGGHALFGYDLEETDGVTITTAVHFTDDGEEIPHALGLTAA